MRRSRTPRLYLHVAAVSGAWILFVLGWIRVLGSTRPATMLVSLIVVAAILTVVVAVTAWWIRHNVAIFRRKGPRRSIPVAAPAPATDALGRTLAANWEAIRSSPLVIIEARGDTKDLVVAGLAS